MTILPHLSGITGRIVTTARGRFYTLEAGMPDGIPVVFVHGNVASATYWEEMLLALPDGYRGLAPDRRGCGASEMIPIDATRGMRDFSDDLYSLVTTLGLPRFHLIGHSLGGTVAMQYVIDHPEQVRSLTLVAPGSPYGFGGTKDVQGTPCWPDYAGSGAGLVNPELVKRLAEQDRSLDSPFSPRQIFRMRYGKAPFQPAREDVLVDSMLSIAIAEGNYPGDKVLSANWPGLAPGVLGVNNALSPKYCNLSGLVAVHPKPDILWIRGDADEIVSDRSLSDVGTLGAMGLIPGWPGAEIFPSQPMVSQTRDVLEHYAANGGRYTEQVLRDTGHTPYLEKPEEFLAIWLPFLQTH